MENDWNYNVGEAPDDMKLLALWADIYSGNNPIGINYTVGHTWRYDVDGYVSRKGEFANSPSSHWKLIAWALYPEPDTDKVRESFNKK